VSATELLLLRHGRTEWNASRRFQGQEDVPLDPVGMAQAVAVAPLLAAREPVLLATSDLQRATATAGPTAARTGLPLAVDPRWREIALGAWQGLTGAQAAVRFPAEHAAWARGEDVRRGGGETYAEVGVRAAAAAQALVAAVEARGGGLVVVVTHGGTIRATLGSLLGLDPARWSLLGPVANVHCSVLRGAGSRGCRLVAHNAPLLAGASPGASAADDGAATGTG